MEGKFETSFIPKKPLAAVADGGAIKPIRTTNFFSLIAIVIFITVLVLAGGVGGYSYVLNAQRESLRTSLEAELKKFEPALIAELSNVDNRIEAIKSLLNRHIALSAFFDFLGKTTVSSVRFSDFKYTYTGQVLTVEMAGQARSFSGVALQAQEFEKDQNKTVISNSAFSNLDLDQSGNVTFVYTGTVQPGSVLYKNIAKEAVTPVTLSTSTPEIIDTTVIPSEN